MVSQPTNVLAEHSLEWGYAIMMITARHKADQSVRPSVQVRAFAAFVQTAALKPLPTQRVRIAKDATERKVLTIEAATVLRPESDHAFEKQVATMIDAAERLPGIRCQA
jgi:hypothetical protein